MIFKRTEKLQLTVTALLRKTLRQQAEVSYRDGIIKLLISHETFENAFGPFLWRIQQLIDEHCPDRPTDLSILIRDAGSRFEHVFKIWRTSLR